MHRLPIGLALAGLLLGAPAASADRYERYVASPEQCPGSDRGGASVARQEAAMRCLINHARRVKRLPRLRADRRLARSADIKVRILRRCDEFTHTPCGTTLQSTFRRAGYIRGAHGWAIGENIAYWGPRPTAAPRDIMLAWLRSPGHRRNVFKRSWRDQGVALVHGRFQGHRDVAIWVSQFGRR